MLWVILNFIIIKAIVVSLKKEIERIWFLNFLMGNLRAYGGCLDSKWR